MDIKPTTRETRTKIMAMANKMKKTRDMNKNIAFSRSCGKREYKFLAKI